MLILKHIICKQINALKQINDLFERIICLQIICLSMICLCQVCGAIDDENYPESAMLKLVEKSQAGKILFESNAQLALANLVSKTIDDNVRELMATDEVLTMDKLSQFKISLIEKLMEGGSLEMLPSKRLVNVYYGPLKLPKMKVTSVSQEVDVRLAAPLKYLAVAQEIIPKLACEDLIVVAEANKDFRIKISEEVREQWKLCREDLNKVLNRSTMRTADDVQAAMVEEAMFKSIFNIFL